MMRIGNLDGQVVHVFAVKVPERREEEEEAAVGFEGHDDRED